MLSFNQLGLSEEVLAVLEKKGFETPTPIQEKTIPAILLGVKDVVGQAQTGTGKTAAFGLPMIELLKENSKNVQALILTPTRELAIQVAEEINSLKGSKRLSIVPIYGGQSIDQQFRALKKGVDIVVGTPGRVMDHLERKTLKIKDISFFVLDEADEMLNMGFEEDVKAIFGQTSQEKRTMLFSATMPNAIMKIAEKFMKEHDVFRVAKGNLTISRTDQIYFEVSQGDKFESFCRIIDMEEDFYGIVFCRTKVEVDTVSSRLIERGYNADGLHGDMSQSLREKILQRFKKKRSNIMVATDVAARGIDVHDLTHVINYSLPQDPESYVHRIGRTGRAGKDGTAITFITPAEYRRLKFISRDIQADIRKEILPKVKDVIAQKRQRIQGTLENIVKETPKPEYLQMAEQLLENNTPGNIIAALLQNSFKEALDEKSYVEIDESRGTVEMRGKTRLFVRQGKIDGLTAKSLADYIKDKCNIRDNDIRDIQIMETFSFVTLPFQEAEQLTEYFKDKHGKGMHMSKANKAKSFGVGHGTDNRGPRGAGGFRSSRGPRPSAGHGSYRGQGSRFSSGQSSSYSPKRSSGRDPRER
ncbi:MAG: DEAD/DEAH box helicase [Candidatus Omnitrophica bacterium]|nr:DEAD/DEAH box helicase [Candidatus Omnitrophota bacterium]